MGAMAFAGFIMICYAALLEGFLLTAENNAVGMVTGHFQIHDLGYRDDPDLYKLINGADPLIAKIEALGHHAAGRLFAFGLAAAGSSSAGVSVRGVDLEREITVSRLYQQIMTGKWLDASDPFGVVIGRKLARTLGVEVGDEMVFVGQAADGSMANELYRVRGIFKSVGEGVDRAGFFMLEKTFRELMVLPAGIHEIAILSGEEGRSLDQQTAELVALAPGLEVKNWRQLQPVVARIVDMSQSSLWIMLLVTYAAVGILTLNGILMSVFERIREFGVMKALGLSPLTVFSIITMEAVLQVAVAIVLASALAIPLSLYGETHPIDLTFLASTSATVAGIAIDPVWYCKVTRNSIVMPIILMFGVTLIAVIYPAAKAALIRPVQAIYYR
ncbi:MAG: FtsX-like permease family protein [Proteobacteria bacterium]|nr:FtsX-like permease family protein [Pseudomonadota bacterium]MBU1714130.1 FtsX-like permease family protein [Pseudomonadota bacterium]